MLDAPSQRVSARQNPPMSAATPYGDKPTRLLAAARILLDTLQAGHRLSATVLRVALTKAFGGTDSQGAWAWKDAYDAAEAAAVLFLRRYGLAMRREAGAGPQGPAAMLAMLERLAALEPSHTRRSEEQVRLQQFSTPLPLAYAAVQAAAIRPGDRVLEPSAGTGLLAVMAHCALRETAGQKLYLNELAPARAGLLEQLFPGVSVDRHNAESIADFLPGLVPSAVLMNPPFSVSPGVERRRLDADLRHIRSAFSMLPPGGRLVAITSHSCLPGGPAWQSAFRYVDPPAQAVFSMAIDGRAYARHGTSFDTRLTVLDRLTVDEREKAGAGPDFDPGAAAADAAELLNAVLAHVPPRRPLAPTPASRSAKDGFSLKPPPGTPREGNTNAPDTRPAERPAPSSIWGPVSDLDYGIPSETGMTIEHGSRDGRVPSPTGPYEEWTPATVNIPGAQPHPTALVQSAAMAAVAHPPPAYRPKLPVDVVAEARLSDAQLESVILAGQAHEKRLPAHYRIGETWETLRRLEGAAHGGPADGSTAHGNSADTDRVDSGAAHTEDGEVFSSPVRFRRGWMLGDGTGCGKGRQVAAIVLDQWLRGNRRALWLSASDKLLEDARRDWAALGGLESDVVPLGKIKQGRPIPARQGILFATYATLRSPARQGRQSRLKQIVEWLAGGLDERTRHEFSGIVVFDEAHAMANAAGSKGSRGEVAPSRQGRAGLRLQNALPDARVLYVSATGATTLAGLAYAQRLGLWGTDETPFEKRTDFVFAMESGGVAAMEVVARDLKALGLYQARALSYNGVEVELLEHALTDEQRRIYDAYANAFKIIHANLQQALESTGICSAQRTLNRNAKSAAMSAFEGAKQRHFGHLLTSMKCPSLLRAIEADRDAGRASVVQLVSTGEALLERRIAEIPASEWNDLNIDLTPRDSILSYLAHAFPVQLQQPYTDEEGNLMSRPVHDDDGNAVLSQEAVAARDHLIERLGALPPVPTALDRILHRFGHEAVAEVTGRSRRVLKIADPAGERLALSTRPASANLSETAAFMDGSKKILVFSQAGGTGRSYHADLGCGNTARRIHYLLEPGWRAEQAIQGLGRTHRTHQASAPMFRPVTTDVKGERRFIATIARRLDSLGALTRGQRDSQTSLGGADAQLFKARDNLESPYARAALRQFYGALWAGYIPDWSLDRFEQATGLKLTYEGNLKDDLPPMPKFLNRLLALPIDEQNALFAQLEERIDANIEQAMEAGTFEQGVESILRRFVARGLPRGASGARTHRRFHRPGGDRKEGPPEPPCGRRRVANARPGAARRRFDHVDGQRTVEARRPPVARALADAGGRRHPEARPAGAPRFKGHRRREGAGGIALARGRGDPMAGIVGRRGAIAAEPHRVAAVAGHRLAPARLGPAAEGRPSRAPPDHRRRRSPDRPGDEPRTGGGAARRVRAGRRPAAGRRRGPRGAHPTRRALRPRQRLAPGAPPVHGRRAHRDRGSRGHRPAGAQAPRLRDRNRLLAHARLRPRRPGYRASTGTVTPSTRGRPEPPPIRIAGPPPSAGPFSSKETEMAPTSTLPDKPVYAFCPEFAPPDGPQQIRIVFQDIPGYVPTALVALTLEDAERLCSKLNARLGLDRDAWLHLAAQSMSDAARGPRSPLH